jgi:hypothetical protein
LLLVGSGLLGLAGLRAALRKKCKK